MRAPEPSPRELRMSFLAVLACALMLTATLCWGIVHRVNQSDDIVRIASASADTVERLNTQIDTLTAQLDRQAKAAKRQRATLQRQNHDLARQIDALVTFLRAHGLSVPDIVKQVAPRPKGPGPRGPRPSPHPASPGPTPSPMPTAPGVLDPMCGLLAVPLICP